MEARAILQKIRQHGFTIKAAGNNILLAPKKLLNDRMINFVKKHKNELLTALYQEQDEHKTLHLKRKYALQEGRLELLRLILRRHLKSGHPGGKTPTDYGAEEYLDWILKQHNYDLEDAITTYRNITPEPVFTCKCGYQKPFCSCCGIPMTDIVSCHQCEHFTPDSIGDGTGIGSCSLGIKWTQELHGHMPLYRHADRHCDKFSKLTD